jgi:hypothetical protein
MHRILEVNEIGPGFLDNLYKKQYPNLQEMNVNSISILSELENGAIYLYQMNNNYLNWFQNILPSSIIVRLLDIQNTSFFYNDKIDFFIKTIDPYIHFSISGSIHIINANRINIYINKPTIQYGSLTVPQFLQSIINGDNILKQILESVEAEIRTCIALSIE